MCGCLVESTIQHVFSDFQQLLWFLWKLIQVWCNCGVSPENQSSLLEWDMGLVKGWMYLMTTWRKSSSRWFQSPDMLLLQKPILHKLLEVGPMCSLKSYFGLGTDPWKRHWLNEGPHQECVRLACYKQESDQARRRVCGCVAQCHW